MTQRKLGIAVVGLGGAVGTTMVAGVELLKKGVVDTEGLPLAGVAVDGLVDYTDIVFAGWDLFSEHLAKAAGTRRSDSQTICRGRRSPENDQALAGHRRSKIPVEHRWRESNFKNRSPGNSRGTPS